MERELTQFQRDCEQRLTAALAAKRRHIVERCVLGRSETYITGKVEGRDVTFWIYADGADFKAGAMHQIFEWPDYSSLDDLAAAFVGQLAEATDQR
jgi:hypothetical protein